jgi:YbgC/YbaW family acyl-CoA thioester hydrolase
MLVRMTDSAVASLQKDTIADYEILIKERDLDSFGHVNNATYMTLFEEARWDVITKRGYGLDRIHSGQIGPIILEANLKFKHEVRNREKVKIVTGVLKHAGKITTLRQVMLNSKGEEACIADFVVGLFDLKARSLIDYTPEWNQALALSPRS